ncbi:MAG: DUF177 domain-containing protein [Armatimonadota bacterium]
MLMDIQDIMGTLGGHKDAVFEEDMHLEFVDFADKVKIKAKATNAGSRIWVEGTIKTRIKLNCVRCCEDFIFPVNVEFKEEFLDKHSEQVIKLKDEDMEEVEFFIYDKNSNIIDINEAVRQSILTSFGINPICGPDCKGICTVCGKNRNLEDCNCKSEVK